jgi:hypothetical protein
MTDIFFRCVQVMTMLASKLWASAKACMFDRTNRQVSLTMVGKYRHPISPTIDASTGFPGID